MSLILLIGDTKEYLSQISATYSKDSYLLTDSNHKPKLKGVCYTSLGDLELSKLYQISKTADKIIYCPPDDEWSSDDIQENTEKLLRDLSAVEKKHIEYSNGEKVRLGVNTPFLKILDDRRTPDQQIWVVGCSFAEGEALKNKYDQRYGQLVSNHFDIPVSFLSEPGTSVDWACDQILRADIKANDIVIWGITGLNRFTWFDQRHEMLKLNFTYLTEQLKHYHNGRAPSPEEKIMFYNMLFDDSRALLGLRHIAQVIEYCRKISANLIMMAHEELSQDRHAEWVVAYLESTENYLKLNFDSSPWKMDDPNEKDFFSVKKIISHRRYLDGTDRQDYRDTYQSLYEDLALDHAHPGPRTHRYVADLLIDFIEKKQWVR